MGVMVYPGGRAVKCPARKKIYRKQGKKEGKEGEKVRE
jgi:hypothetical protein